MSAVSYPYALAHARLSGRRAAAVTWAPMAVSRWHSSFPMRPKPSTRHRLPSRDRSKRLQNHLTVPPPWRRHWPLSILRVGNSRQASGPTPPQGLPGQASPVPPGSADPAEAGGTAPPAPRRGPSMFRVSPPCTAAAANHHLRRYGSVPIHFSGHAAGRHCYPSRRSSASNSPVGGHRR